MGKHAGNQGGHHTDTCDRILTALEAGATTTAKLSTALGLTLPCASQAVARLVQRHEVVRIDGRGGQAAGVWALPSRCDGSALEAAWPMPVELPAGGEGRVVRAEP
jgi:hypothetical protein